METRRDRLMARLALRLPIVLGLALLAPIALAEEPAAAGERVRGYVPPPKELRLVDGHWTPYDPPVPPEGAQVHVVQRGDTLWDLAATYYDDPYLWPIIWDENRYVLYSHWIYPGDPLVVPPHPTLVTEEGVETAVAEAEPEPEPEPVIEPVQRPRREVPFERRAAEPKAQMESTRPALIPAAEEQELICAGQLYERFDPAPLSIAGREEPERFLQSTGDIVYLSAGLDMGMAPGDEFLVLRPTGPVRHPDSGKPIAHFVQRLGRVRVVAVQPRSATAMVEMACDGMIVGDFLVPYRELPVPMIERIPLAQLATPFPNQLTGRVVVAEELDSNLAGAGDNVGIDLGHRQGVTAGDRILFWRPGEAEDLPRRILAQGVVLSTNGGGSVVKILESNSEVLPGDWVEIL
jgi:hypothetical protein